MLDRQRRLGWGYVWESAGTGGVLTCRLRTEPQALHTPSFRGQRGEEEQQRDRAGVAREVEAQEWGCSRGRAAAPPGEVGTGTRPAHQPEES